MNFKAVVKRRGDSLSCPLPLELDTYQGCNMCEYCFIKDLRAIWNKDTLDEIKVGETISLNDQLNRAFNHPRSEIEKAINIGIPIKLGSKSDCFQDIERTAGATLDALRILKYYNASIIIETKGTILAEEPYFSLITSFDKMPIIAFSVLLGEKERLKLEPSVASLKDRMKILEQFHDVGFFTTLKIEPIMPMINDTKENFVELCQYKDVVDSVSFYNYRTSNYHRAREVFAKNEYNWDVMAEKNWNEDYLFRMGTEAFSVLRESFKLVTTADFVNFGLQNSIPVCCGFMPKNYYKFTWVKACNMIKEKGSLSFEEFQQSADLIFSDDLETAKSLWNFTPNKKRFSVCDVRGIHPEIRDGKILFTNKEVKTLADRFA